MPEDSSSVSRRAGVPRDGPLPRDGSLLKAQTSRDLVTGRSLPDFIGPWVQLVFFSCVLVLSFIQQTPGATKSFPGQF